jgi:hypothetical protein
MDYRHLVKKNLSKKITAILAVFAARLPIWQAKTPSKEEAGQAGLHQYIPHRKSTNISSTFSIKLSNLTIKRLASYQMMSTLKD